MLILVSDAVDLEKKENEKISVKVLEWKNNSSMNSLDLYRSKVGQSDLSPSENLCQILTCVPRTGTVNLNAVTFEINPQIHLRALFESISGPSIIELNLSGQNLGNQIPLLSKCLDNLSNLEKLYLTNTRLTKENFKAISCRSGFIKILYFSWYISEFLIYIFDETKIVKDKVFDFSIFRQIVLKTAELNYSHYSPDFQI